MSDETAADRLKRVWAGLKSQVMSRDPDTGELYLGGWQDLKDDFKQIPMSKRRRQSRPGIVDETVSLPALMALVPGGEKYVPDWAIAAAERADQMHQAARQEEGLSEPHGFSQNAEEALGVMLGQVPIPMTKLRALGAVKSLPTSTKVAVTKKILGSAPEWFSPSIDPSIANYAAGTAFGGGMGAYTDHQQDQADEEANFERATRGLADRLVKGEPLIPGFGGGGKIAGLRGALHALSFDPRSKAGFRPETNDSVAQLRAAASQVMTPEQSAQLDRWIKSRESLPELGNEDVDRLLQLHDRIMKPADSTKVPWEQIFKED